MAIWLGEIKCPECEYWQIPGKYCPQCGYKWVGGVYSLNDGYLRYMDCGGSYLR